MSVLDHQVVKRGIFVPKGLISRQDLLYDEGREIIEDSCLRRGENKSENISNPPPILPDAITVLSDYNDKRLLFLGDFQQGHYGHLLTEGIARFWYLLGDNRHHYEIPTTKKPFGTRTWMQSLLKPRGIRWRSVLDSFGFKADDFLVVPADSAIQAKEIIVPECSMYNRYNIHDNHLAVSRTIAKNVLGPTRIEVDTTPIYLSRGKTRKVVNKYLDEGRIEEYCKKAGFRIIYPERLSLKEQMALFNRHDVFIGIVGSAFLSLLFRMTDRKATNIYLATGRASSQIVPRGNLELIDNLMRNSSHYIDCIHAESKRVFVCDSEKAIRGISDVVNTLS